MRLRCDAAIASALRVTSDNLADIGADRRGSHAASGVHCPCWWCGSHSFSASSVSAVVKKLDGELARFARRRLSEPIPYLILDARYEKVRIDSVIQSQAVLIAIGIDWEGRRQVLGVELANRESRSSWRDFLMGLKERGLHGVEFVVSDDHEGLKRAIAECLSGAPGSAATCTS